MAPPVENAPAARGEIGGIGRQPLLAELAGYRERLGPILASTVLPFALVVYLALEGGGYDVVVRSEVGMAIWWIVLLGALVGVLPVRPLGREQVGLALLLALAAWTASGSPGRRAASEAWRRWAASSYSWACWRFPLGAGSRGAAEDRSRRRLGDRRGGRPALLSRLEPSWFPENELGSFLPSVETRLAYPSTTGTASPP